VSDAAGKRVLAVDHGDRRTGLAATAGATAVVVPLPTLRGLEDPQCADAVAALAADRGSDVIVVGLPLDVRGAVGPRARRTLEFVAVLRGRAACPVETVDETYSTDEAHDRLKAAGIKAARRKDLADSVAAMVICERYVAELRRRRGRPEG
jgi:putative Holliday junction resolvase